jgi:hypothetical protein
MKDVSAGAGRRLIDALDQLPARLEALIADQGHLAALAKKYAGSRTRISSAVTKAMRLRWKGR